MSSEADCALLVAEIGRAYDALPYASGAFACTHPNRLGAIGYLHGLNCAKPSACRVLEIGCASGGNLLPIALNYPASEFVGVDLSSAHIAEARRAVDELAIKNVRLIRADIRALPQDVGRFDYIICHGVYSWVPSEVRQSILKLCGERLAAGGVAYISFNTYPGWHKHDRLRRLVDCVVKGQVTDPIAAVERAKDWLRKLPTGKSSDPRSNWMDNALQESIRAFLSASPEYLYHEYLNRVNEPEQISSFLRQARSHELHYINHADWSYAAQAERAVAEANVESLGLSRDALETLVDDLLCTQFRCTVLCRVDETITERPLLDRLDELWVACRFSLLSTDAQSDDLAKPSPASLSIERNGQVTRLMLPAAIDVVQQIWRARPEYRNVASIIQVANQHTLGPTVTHAIRHSVLMLTKANALDLVMEPFRISSCLSRPPKLDPWASYQLRAGARHVSGISHEELQLNEAWLESSPTNRALGPLSEMLSRIAQQLNADSAVDGLITSESQASFTALQRRELQILRSLHTAGVVT